MKRTALVRKTPLAKKRKAPKMIKGRPIKGSVGWKKAWGDRCQVKGCTKKYEVAVGTDQREVGALVDAFCRSHARIESLRRWSLAVRTGQCELSDFHVQYGVRCAGQNVAGHGFGKGAYPGVMFELWNGFSKCSGLNAWVEDHTLEWDGYLREVWGDDYHPRRKMALGVRKYDLADVLARLGGVSKEAAE